MAIRNPILEDQRGHVVWRPESVVLLERDREKKADPSAELHSLVIELFRKRRRRLLELAERVASTHDEANDPEGPRQRDEAPQGANPASLPVDLARRSDAKSD